MCGHFGLVNVSSKSRGYSSFIRDAFTTSMLRGTDSSGIAIVDTAYASTEVHKLPVPGCYYVGDRVASRLIREADTVSTVVMCHVRHATVGSVNLDNAHPFEITTQDSTLVGAHNGTLTSWQSRKTAKDFNSDSKWALSRIAEEGADAFEEITGAFTFVWWDSKEPDVLNMARNDERPMWIALLQDGGMAYASEAGMLYWLLERNNIKVEKMFELEVDKLYKFNVDRPHEYTSSHLPKYIPTYTANTGTYSYNRNTNYALTHVEKVQRLIDTVIDEAKKEETKKPSQSQPSVTEAEVKEAADIGWLNQEVEFLPLEVLEDGSVSGEVDFLGALVAGVVRNPDDELEWNHVWHCKILGINDDGTSMTYVLSQPCKTTAMYEEGVH